MPDTSNQDGGASAARVASRPRKQRQSSDPEVLRTREGQMVASISRMVGMAQCFGVFILVAVLVRYNAEVSGGMEGQALGSPYGEILPVAQQMLGPEIMLIPVVLALFALVSWGLWHVRAWARRAAMMLSLVLAGAGVAIAYVVVNQVVNQIDMDVPWISEKAGFEIAQLGGGMALFYVLILAFMLIPTVSRVYREATAQVAATEERFRVRSDVPRDHFKPGRDVSQL